MNKTSLLKESPFSQSGDGGFFCICPTAAASALHSLENSDTMGTMVQVWVQASFVAGS
ncbi:hypothetical protein QOZ95_004933 [Paenibacillus brasilensis]|uniref:Uncharacterized protein n=1 Tax=Paenibacillus brasilensis TaxID=128574 RepID=A0ABU0L614_9BACL|nr:hypothetical protein [Paenibacillus brasilensis]